MVTITFCFFFADVVWKSILCVAGKLFNPTALKSSYAQPNELALSKGREDLAKGALNERQKAADLADSLRAEIAMLDDRLRASEGDVARLQGKLRDARSRQSAIQTRLESAQ